MTLPPDKRRVLVVDDDSQVLSKISGFLFRSGAWEVWQSHSGARALEIWAEHKDEIDVVISDVDLPDISGPALAKRFKDEKLTLGVIFISGHPRNTRVDASQIKVLCKPFTAAQVVRAIHEL